MAAEFRTHYTATGSTVYAVLARVTDGFVWNGATYESPLTANWANYKITCTEKSTTQLYYGNMPAAQPAGLYDVLFYFQVGGSPATTDTLIERRTLDWNATTVASLGKYATGNTETWSLQSLSVINATGADAVTINATTTGNGNGINCAGFGTGHGFMINGGTNSSGLHINGGTSSGQGILINTTSGDAVSLQPTAGHGLTITANGGTAHGLNISGNGTGHGALFKSGTSSTGDGIHTQSSSTNGNGLAATGTGTGTGVAANLTGNLTGNVTGNLTGSVGSVTGAVGSVTAAVSAILTAAGLDNVVVESGLNARQALAIIASSVAGVLAGAIGPTVTIQGAGVVTNRMTVSVDSVGDRTSVTLNPPA